MKRKMMLIVAVCSAVAVVSWYVMPHRSSHSFAAKQPGAPPQPGYVVHLDDRGRPTTQVSRADRAQLDAAVSSSVNTSTEGLVERPSPVAGGGIIVDLQGRFLERAVRHRRLVVEDLHPTAP